MKDPIVKSVRMSIKALRNAIIAQPTDKAKRLLSLSLRLEQELIKPNPSIEVLDEINEQIKQLG